MPNYKNFEIVKAKVTGTEKYGAFVELENNYVGLIHISEISENFVKNIEDYVKIGEEIYCRIIDIDDENKRLKLSLKNIDYHLGVVIDNKNNGFHTLKKSLPKWIEEYYQQQSR